ncbi:MAG: GNAT family N-acetyltransferase [Planctomycetes bacterium]|nr:GNAT family N-acetyltransferase [Planctomycetota bacterium]
MNIRPFTVADIPFGLRLSAQNDWNQIEADWRRQLELEPTGGFVAERDGTAIGTACACVFDDVAWINLVLVDRPHRRQGVGTALMRHVLAYLDARGAASARLDATALGQPVYEKLGFVGEFSLTRFEGIPSALAIRPASTESNIAAITMTDLPAIFTMDAVATHTRREKLLRRLLDADPRTARKYEWGGRMLGYCFARPGARAWQIGPMQGTPDAGRALFLDAARRFAGRRIYVDIPTDNPAAIAAADLLGLTPQRSFLRMTRGQPVRENLATFWTAFGPEKG